MQFKRILWFFSILLLISAVISGYLAWRDMRQAVVIVEWETASELDTAGFNLYRSEDPAGPFVQINETLIPASPDPLIGGSYSYEDQSALPNTIYYYQLEDVQSNGSSTRFGPIQVEAVSGGGLQLAMAGLLALVGIFSMYILRS